jgi:hypothetical protein
MSEQAEHNNGELTSEDVDRKVAEDRILIERARRPGFAPGRVVVKKLRGAVKRLERFA